MAQDFRNNLQRNVGTSPVTLITAGDFDAVIGIRICNVTTSTVLASCQIVNGGNDHFIAKECEYSTKLCNRTNSRWCKNCFSKW